MRSSAPAITLRDIDLFLTRGIGRGNNDANNKKREAVLCMLYHATGDFLADATWSSMQTKWREFLGTLCSAPYDDVRVHQRGGRSENYDLDITYLHTGVAVSTVKAEFKHNAASLAALPQYFSPADNKPYMPVRYADFFYGHYIDQVCPTGVEKPDRDTYLSLVYSDNYSRHPMFQALRDSDRANRDRCPPARARVVKDSIAAYLDEYKTQLNMAELSKDIRERQMGKVFILWDLNTFRSDTIHDDEMEIASVEGVKNKNVLVAVSKAGTKHNMLLRWKNHQGVLYPAWQISLSR
jgi:hypothetical protein